MCIRDREIVDILSSCVVTALDREVHKFSESFVASAMVLFL